MVMNIEEYIMSKEWKFGELLQLTETSKRVAEELYEEITVIDMINNLWSKRIEVADGISFGQLYKNLAMEYLTQEVMDAFKKYFESATVSFDPPTLLQDQKGIVEELPLPPKPKTINKKQIPKYEKTKNTDGTDLPPGVERL
tara:strand:- start:617 stop:1042 length:426 start_codon:yes stop_codon:yes gene_type:complete